MAGNCLVLPWCQDDTWDMPVTCPKCGRETERREGFFCDGCGTFLGWEHGETADSQLYPPPEPQQGGQRAAVQVRLGGELIAVAPGNAESTTFTIKNLGTQVEQFRCVLTGPEWLAAEPATMTVFPGDELSGTIQ